MITENLFDEVLVKPAQDGATELLVVSGYADANMAYRHLAEPTVTKQGVRIKLVYGMAARDGVLLADHSGFTRLEQSGLFECHYRVQPPAVHSKVYVWMAHGNPVKAFVGSANYTQPGFGFGRNNGEAMSEADPNLAKDYFDKVILDAMEVGHEDIESRVTLRRHGPHTDHSGDCRNVPLVSRRAGGDVPPASGLNWGHSVRRTRRQNLDEAYIQIGRPLGREGFFPTRPTRFTIIADDDFTFVAVRAQKNPGGGEAIETPEDNALLGRYFRHRLGIPYGTPFSRELLEAYGRIDVTFCKTDHDGIYTMDFSVPPL